MAELLVTPDPVVRARSYLQRYVATVEGGVPADWKWAAPLVVLLDGGGGGEYDRVLSEARLTVEASAPTRGEASALARRVLALLRAWQDAERGVYWGGEVSRPAYFPDDETGTPLYVFTVSLVFRAIPEAIDPL